MTALPRRGRRAGPERGSALLVAVVVVAVLGIVALGVVARANRDADQVGAKRHYDQTVSCADAARDLLMSQFSAYGIAPASLVLDVDDLDGKTLASGHYDAVAVTSVTKATGASSASFGVSDISNRIGSVQMGGQVYRMTVVCQGAVPPGGSVRRANEVEYLVRFGL